MLGSYSLILALRIIPPVSLNSSSLLRCIRSKERNTSNSHQYRTTLANVKQQHLNFLHNTNIMEFIDTLSNHTHLSPLAIQIGFICLFSQLALTFICSKLLPKGPWSEQPTFTAHQVVALPLMIILTYYGWKEWEFTTIENTVAKGLELTSHDRVFGFSKIDDIPLAIGTGAILMWDIPMGIFSPSLRDPIMLGHHIGMFLVAAVIGGMFSQGGQMIGYYYAPFYFGVIETSSVFLSVVAQFHPKRKAWYGWLHNKNHSSESARKLLNAVNNVNEVSRILFAVTFMLFRGIYFPYTSFCHAIPDLWNALENPPEGVPLWTCYFLCVSLFLFSCLQSYWGVLVANQIKKAVFGGEKDGSESGKKKD